MTMTHDEMIAVLQAHKDGKEIEIRNPLLHEPTWQEFAGSGFDFIEREYRVKPTEIEVWIVVRKDGINKSFNDFKEASIYLGDYLDATIHRLIVDKNWRSK